MAYQFKKHKMIDGKRYGPTDNGWYYQPADYHGKVCKVNQGDRNFYTQYIPSHLLKQIAKVCCVRHNTIIIGVVSLSG